MANQTMKWAPSGGALKNIVKKLLDMGDGTHAEVVATVPSGGAPVGGGITLGAETAVANSGGASTQLVAAAAGRKSIHIWNPPTNGPMNVNYVGGTATLNSYPLLPGDSIYLEGTACPVGAINFIGTAGQNLIYVQGT